jgi:hypothetical protein
MSIESVYAEAAASAARRDVPEGISVTVVTGDPTAAMMVAQQLAAILYPDRRIGAVLHVREPGRVEVMGIEVVVEDRGPVR